MKHPETHHIIGLFYSQEEISELLNIKRGSYTKNISIRGQTYHRYMRILTQQLLKDIVSAEIDSPNQTRHYAALKASLVEASRRSFKLNMGARPTEDSR